MITYNHEKYIAQAIESVLMQKVNFTIELIIGEDCSTDKTRKIALQYKSNFPDKIKLLLPDHNLGMMKNFTTTIKACSGRYIALLEGDDYWTDPLKLQKQVDFLDNNPEFSVCFHRAKVIYDNDDKSTISNQKEQKKISTIDDVFDKSTYILTCTQMFRNHKEGSLPEWFYKSWSGDYPMNIYHASLGKIYFMDEVMAVYRKHPGALTGEVSQENATIINRSINRIELLDSVNKYYDFKYSKTIKKVILGQYFKIADILIDDKAWRRLFKIVLGRLFNSESRNSFNLYLTIRIMYIIARKVFSRIIIK